MELSAIILSFSLLGKLVGIYKTGETGKIGD